VIEGLSLIPNAKFQLRIENLTDFPNATFDDATGVFEWTPPAGFVDTLDKKEMKLNVLIYTTNLSKVRRRNANITINIESSKEAPTIESMGFENNQTSMREGEILNFNVSVRDITGINSNDGRPSLSLSVQNNNSPYNTEDTGIITYVSSVPTQDPTDKSLWNFRLRVDLRSREITNSKKNITISAKAISRYRVPSVDEDLYLDIFTSLKSPVLSWAGTLQMKAGVKNSFAYMVFDPRGEGEVQQKLLTDCTKIHANLKCGACTSSTDPAMGAILTCPITWDIPSDYLVTGGKGYVGFDIQVSAKSKYWSDPYQLPPVTVTRFIQVLPPDIILSSGGK
jgi:hypothetical protein